MDNPSKPLWTQNWNEFRLIFWRKCFLLLIIISHFWRTLISSLKNSSPRRQSWFFLKNMGQQLIENLWPFFGFARLLGMFPYKRILTENGMMELKPISKIHQGLYGCTRWMLTTVSISLVTTWFFFNTTRTYDQYSQCLADYNGGHSVTYVFALLFLMLFSNLTGILLLK